MKPFLIAILLTAGFGLAQPPQPPMKKGPPLSPSAETTIEIGGKNITIKYSAPSLRGRHAFTKDGIISHDKTYPVWRAGANSATALETTGTLTIGNLTVPAGNYTLFVDIGTTPWQLIVNKQTGQWGLAYDKAQDLGRVPMTMSKPAAPIETYRMMLFGPGGDRGRLELGWDDVLASVNFTVK